MNLKYTKPLKVLYIEDDETLLVEVKEMLSNFFDEITTATNGLEALNIYKEKYFDIIISDIKMPKMDGIELSQQIKEIDNEQEIVIISAYNESDKLLSLMKIGVTDFILKPMEYEQVISILEKVSKNIYYKKQSLKVQIQQSKMAQMGEMIDMIAHQWLQFLHVLNMQTELLEIENKENTLTKEKISKYAKDNMSKIDELSETLKEFRTFFQEKDKEKINLKDLVNQTLLLLKDYLINNLVNIEENMEDIIVDIYPNEFKQIIINIITNMVEQFKTKNIKTKIIKIYTKDNVLFIEDNAGGIPSHIIKHIFDNNFTTKKEGTGKGLYLSKLIIEKINGEVQAENIENGARFMIKVENGK